MKPTFVSNIIHAQEVMFVLLFLPCGQQGRLFHICPALNASARHMRSADVSLSRKPILVQNTLNIPGLLFSLRTDDIPACEYSPLCQIYLF